MKNYFIKSFCVLLSLVSGSISNAADSLAVVENKTKSSVCLETSFLQSFPGSTWNAQKNIPERIVVDGGIVIKPLLHGDEASEVLVFDLHSKQSNITGYADGRRRTIEQSAAIFKRHADRWEQGILHSGFGVYLSVLDNLVAFGIVGVGLSGVDGVGEFFVLLKSEHRAKGHGSKTAIIMAQWAKFLMDMGVKFGQKPLDVVIATSNVNNTPSQSLLAKSGYLPATQADIDRFKGTSIILEGVEISVEAAVPSDSWYKGKHLPFSQLGVLSDSKHGSKKALFVFRLEERK